MTKVDFRSVDFPNAGSVTGTLTIPVENDSRKESNSIVTVTLLAHPDGLGVAKYTIPTPAPSASATVIDDDSRIITVSSEYRNIIPGSELIFKVSAFPPPTTPIEVPVTARDETNSSLVITPTTITVGTSGEATARVTTLPTSTGNVTLTVGSVDTYGSSVPKTVRVISPGSPARLIITGPDEPVLEGQLATFNINATIFGNREITAEVDVRDLATKGTNFVENQSYYVRFPAFTSNVSFSIRMKRDSDASADGILVATLQNGVGYTTSSPNNTALAKVYDIDIERPTVLSISRNTETIYEGEDAVYTVTRTGDITNPLTFKYDVIDSGDVIDGEGTEKVGTILANQPSLVLPALTTKTGKSLTGDSGVTLRIRSVLEDNTLEYRVAPQADSVRKIAVIAKPELVLSIEPNYILAGGTF